MKNVIRHINQVTRLGEINLSEPRTAKQGYLQCTSLVRISICVIETEKLIFRRSAVLGFKKGQDPTPRFKKFTEKASTCIHSRVVPSHLRFGDDSINQLRGEFKVQFIRSSK